MSFDIWDGKKIVTLDSGDEEFWTCWKGWRSVVYGDGLDRGISDRRKKIIWTEILISTRLRKLDK
jgi:hypothetical protein